MQIIGHAVCLGSDVDTDVIIAGRYLRTKDRQVWADHVFEDYDPALKERLPGAVIVAGKNFGCGSSREQAAVALKVSGVAAVVAPTFARIFFRNAINLGLPVAEGSCTCSDNAQVVLDLTGGYVECGSGRWTVTALSPRMRDILEAGGLVSYWRAKKP
jgi:3-isopropylmalate dehydratase small subunit